ncbi:MAG: hypothetical protein QNK37_20800 [Acidobacteriota bacterium]|nr:hypothetical protein [Acidobacteriota bacterium]
MPEFKNQSIPEGQWWSPLTPSEADLNIENLAEHPRVLLDPSRVLPTPTPQEEARPCDRDKNCR